MSSFIRLTTGGHDRDKKLNLGGVRGRIRMLTTEWNELSNSTNDKLLRGFARKLLGTNSTFDTNEEAIEAIKHIDIMSLFDQSNVIDNCIETLFHTWRQLIETAIIAVLNTKGMRPPDLSHSIDTSSPLIYFLMKDRDPELTEHRSVFKDIEYDYRGYCPLQSMDRLLLLLEFPIMKLLPHAEFEEVYMKILDMPELHMTHLESVKWKGTSLKSYIRCVINFYNEELPIIESIEEYYTQTALNIDSISYMIEHNITSKL